MRNGNGERRSLLLVLRFSLDFSQSPGQNINSIRTDLWGCNRATPLSFHVRSVAEDAYPMSSVTDDWVLGVCENPGSFNVYRRLRDVLKLPASAIANLRGRLPGVFKRGSREDLEKLYWPLHHAKLRVSLFPAWQLDPEPTETTPDAVDSQEYEVYSAICRTDLFRFDLSLTFADVTGDMRSGYVSPEDRLLLEDLQQKERHVRLRKKFTSPGGLTFLSERRRADLCCREEGVFTLTRVGFDSVRRFALVGFSYYGGELCGVGYILVFEQEKGNWKRVGCYTAWVS